MARRDVVLRRISPLSAFRVGLAFSLVGLVAWLLAVSLVWFGMGQAGIVEQVNSLITDVGGDFEITFGLVLSASALIGAAMAVLMTILSPIIALIFNAIAELFGGLEVHLADY